MTITICKIQPEEVLVLQQLAIQTFTETFGQENTAEQLQTYLDEAYSLDVLKAELQDPESAVYGAWDENELVGYLKVNWGGSQTEQELDNAFEIQRIYVQKAYQGMGMGKRLFEKALELAASSPCEWVWLGVWEKNVKAQAFYKKYGFEKFSEHRFSVGDKIDIDWLMKKSLKS